MASVEEMEVESRRQDLLARQQEQDLWRLQLEEQQRQYEVLERELQVQRQQQQQLIQHQQQHNQQPLIALATLSPLPMEAMAGQPLHAPLLPALPHESMPPPPTSMAPAAAPPIQDQPVFPVINSGHAISHM